MKLKLAHAKNPDISGGYWETPRDPGRPQWVEVVSFEQASAICRSFIVTNGLGSGNWTGGDVRVGRQLPNPAFWALRGRCLALSQHRQYEYTILDTQIAQRYGRVWNSCQYMAENMRQAISTACVSLAQRVIEDTPDTELLAAVLYQVGDEDLKQFNSWRESRKALVQAVRP